VRISETYGPGDMRLLKLFRGGPQRALGSRSATETTSISSSTWMICPAACLAACRRAGHACLGRQSYFAGSGGSSTNQPRWLAHYRRRGQPYPPGVCTYRCWPVAAAAVVFESTFGPVGTQKPGRLKSAAGWTSFFRKSFHFSTLQAERLLGFRAAPLILQREPPKRPRLVSATRGCSARPGESCNGDINAAKAPVRERAKAPDLR